MSIVIIDLDDKLDENEMCKKKVNLFSNQISPINVCLDTTLSEKELLQAFWQSSRLSNKTKAAVLPFFPPFKCPFEQCKKVFEDRIKLQKHYR